MTRRMFLSTPALAAAQGGAWTDFQIACMTLGWGGYPFERGVQGVAAAGFKYIAIGPNHTDTAGKRIATIPEDAPAAAAKERAQRCRDAGLDPVLMFGSYYPERPKADEIYKRRIEQAHAAGIPNILTFGSPKGTAEDFAPFVKSLQAVADQAKSAGVSIGVKQHGGITGTGEMTFKIVREVGSPAVQLYYDAGNVLWYNNASPVADMAVCGGSVRGFAIKDFRVIGTKRTTCGPGMGVVDHFELLRPVARVPGKIVLACETLFEPFTPRPAGPEGIDALARRAREHLDTVTRALKVVL
ncbi:MAG: sugar phosphate isomerase/epimerase [Acidobacteria bacterium]|nr:sugar phosphate isomerase/epimerase [Acidobacteriota bacterium]